MSIRNIKVRGFRRLVRQLEEIALDQESNFFVFRGHREEDWRLCSTFSRFSTSRLPEYNPLAVEQLTLRFVRGMATTGNFEMSKMSRRERLEIARHHGVPSPLIDVTQSPFIALWFAFNGVRGSVDQGNAVLYAINWNYLAVAYSKLANQMGWEDHLRAEYGKPSLDIFRWDIANFFDQGYPQPILKFLPYASSTNRKVHRQMGCFIYDTLDYNSLNVQDLEHYLSSHASAVPVGGGPILTKFLVPKRMSAEVFDYLDLMGISGARLFDDYSGVAADVINSFNYNPRYMTWDLKSDIGY